MPTVGTCFSGIGGADAGFCAAGWDVAFQAEIDPYRRDVLARHWPSTPRADDAAAVVGLGRRADLVYAELPDRDVGRWWPIAEAASALSDAWLVVEMSPSIPCDGVLRALACGGGWLFRFVVSRTTVKTQSLPPHAWHVRSRALVVATKRGRLMDAFAFDGFSMDVETTIGAIAAKPGSVAFEEASIGIRDGWTCGCGSELLCVCKDADRFAALREATPPATTRWLGKLLAETLR